MFCTKAARSTRSSPLGARRQLRRRLVTRTVLVGDSELNDAQVMGPNIHAGEVLQLLVPTGVWKMSKLLDDDLTAASTEGAKDHCGCLITEVVFPGFAWEDHWINRVLQSRAVELAMLVKTQGFAILLKIIASAAPILVSVFAFLTFVAQGHELTVGIAFTVRFLDVVTRLSLTIVS